VEGFHFFNFFSLNFKFPSLALAYLGGQEGHPPEDTKSGPSHYRLLDAPARHCWSPQNGQFSGSESVNSIFPKFVALGDCPWSIRVNITNHDQCQQSLTSLDD